MINAAKPSRQTANERNSVSSCEKIAAHETLGKLRSALASLDHEMDNGNFAGSQLQEQMRVCELLQNEVMTAIGDSGSSERSSFKRRLSGQAALSGLCFA